MAVETSTGASCKCLRPSAKCCFFLVICSLTQIFHFAMGWIHPPFFISRWAGFLQPCLLYFAIGWIPPPNFYFRNGLDSSATFFILN